MNGDKLLIVNADDFGFTRDVNEGILDAHRRGIVTATTLMANGAAFAHAVELAQSCPTLDIGCHFTLIGGRSLLPPFRLLPQSWGELVVALARGRLSVEEELEAQLERILSTGLAVTHLDTHKHTHVLPGVLEAVARLARRYNIRWIRRPFDFPQNGSGSAARRLIGGSLQLLSRRFHRILESHGCRATDHFFGFALTGRLKSEQAASLIENLPPGTTEWMTHPGYCTAELLQAPTRLKRSRYEELCALTGEGVRQAIQIHGVRLAGFRDL